MKPPKWTSYIREVRTCLDGATDEAFLWSISQNHRVFCLWRGGCLSLNSQPVEGSLAPYRMCHLVLMGSILYLIWGLQGKGRESRVVKGAAMRDFQNPLMGHGVR